MKEEHSSSKNKACDKVISKQIHELRQMIEQTMTMIHCETMKRPERCQIPRSLKWQSDVATDSAEFEGRATPVDIEALMRKAMLEILPSMLPKILAASSVRDQPGPPPSGRH